MSEVSSEKSRGRKRASRPARTPEERENQLISLAYDVAEQRLRDGSATAQEVVHFLRLGTTRNQLEQEKIALESELLKTRKSRIESEETSEELYKNAIEALTRYQGKNHGSA